jgi:hypothetical protein
MAGKMLEIGQRGESARDHGIECATWNFFDTPVLDRKIDQTQFYFCLALERGLLFHGFYRSHVQFRAGNRQGYARQPGTAADIGPTPSCERRLSKRRQQRQRIEQVVGQHFLLVADCRQVIGAVPFFQQADESQQLCLPRVRQVQSHAGQRAAQFRRERHAALRRFRKTRSSDIAAGVTPCTREAWPRVCGRAWPSFWRTSKDRPRTSL